MNSTQVLAISRAMIHAETSEQRNVLLKVLQVRKSEHVTALATPCANTVGAPLNITLVL